MAWRITEADVREIVDSDSTIAVRPFIAMASRLTDRVSSADSLGQLSSADLIQIELCLAAHFYLLRDKEMTEKKTGDASAKFAGKFGMGLESTSWGQQALIYDVSGYLQSLGKGGGFGLTWLGKPVSAQIDYEDRD